MNTKNYLKLLEEAIEGMKELKDILRDVLFFQIDNTRPIKMAKRKFKNIDNKSD